MKGNSSQLTTEGLGLFRITRLSKSSMSEIKN